jgi:hypothetical protein
MLKGMNDKGGGDGINENNRWGKGIEERREYIK